MAVLYVLLLCSALSLEIHLVPHSHIPATWIQDIHVPSTQTYYDDQLRSSLDNMLDLLSQSSLRRFTWSEV